MDPGPFSNDGYWWWDGTTWKPAFSPDYRWRWDGRTWISATPALRPGSGLPLGAWIGIIAGVLAIVLIIVSVVVIAVGVRTSTPPSAVTQAGPSGQAVTSTIPCDQLEHTQVHHHAVLQIVYQGTPVSIPTDVGRSAFCYYWLHMHAGEPGMIHIEAPLDRTFTLGDFFAVWSAWGRKMQPLDSRRVSSFALTPNQSLIVYVDIGAGPHVFQGDPSSIVLLNHEVITLEITPPTIDPPPAYTFPPGF